MMRSFLVCTAVVWCSLGSPALAQAPTENTGAISEKILDGARAEAAKGTPYIMEYRVINYPGGDVPEGTGVCTDLVIRSLRHAGIDLQKEVQTDRRARPSAYPDIWDKKQPDKNIDHRRCPNLVAWFRKHAEVLPIKIDTPADKQGWDAGDIVFYVRENASHPWHVGIVSDRRDADGTPFIIDSFPPKTSESHRLDDFAPIHSHFRIRNR